MATRSNIGILRKDGTIEAVYSHYDGYPSGVGKTLRDHYTDRLKIEKLIDLGDVSSLEKNITKPEGHSMMNRIDGYTAFYGRDRGDENTEARIYDSLDEVQENDYTYIWDESKGKWFFTDNYDNPDKMYELDKEDLAKFAKGGLVKEEEFIKIMSKMGENEFEDFYRGALGDDWQDENDTRKEAEESIIEMYDGWYEADREGYNESIEILNKYYPDFNRNNVVKYAKGGMTDNYYLTITPSEFSDKVERILDYREIKYRLDPDKNPKDQFGTYISDGYVYTLDTSDYDDIEDVMDDLEASKESDGVGNFSFHKNPDNPAESGYYGYAHYEDGGKIKEFVFYQVEENEAGDGETYDNLDEAEMHWERLTDEQREEGTLMKLYWECEDGVCDITDTEIIYGKGGTLHKSIKHHYGLGGYLASGAIGAYLGAKNPTKVRKVTDPLDKAFSDIGKNFSDKKYAEGGDVEDKEYVLERYYVNVNRDSYTEGELDYFQTWDSSDYGDDDKTFSSKSALMDFIQEVVYRDTSVLTENEDFSIDSDDDETTIDYAVLCKFNKLGRGYDYYSKASDEEIEKWKKGDLELFSVGFTFKVKVYETRKKAEFARGGETDDWLFVGEYPTGTLYSDRTKTEFKLSGSPNNYKDIAYVFDKKQDDGAGSTHRDYRLKIYSDDKKYQPLIKELEKEYGKGKKMYAEGGSIKDNKNAMITGGILGVLLGVFLNR